MSWAAHELESYVIGKHLRVRLSYIAVLIGCLAPDMFTKLPVYGLHLGPISIDPRPEPWAYHRGWVGVGPTHSLAFGVMLGLVVLVVTRNQAWALGLLIGQWAHSLTDICDSVGTMLFFPFTTQHYTIGMWAYASQQGKFGDADAYYSSLGGVWDLFWLAMVLLGWRSLTREHFFDKVVPADPAVWSWLRRRLHFSDRAIVAMYRAFFCYGAARIVAWTLIARVRPGSRVPIDLHWGGPSFVTAAPSNWPGWSDFLANSARGLAMFSVACLMAWWLVGQRLWRRAGAD